MSNASLDTNNCNWVSRLNEDGLYLAPLVTGASLPLPADYFDATPPVWTGHDTSSHFAGDYHYVTIGTSDPSPRSFRCTKSSLFDRTPKWEEAETSWTPYN